jgi:hypothetical protein
LTPNCWKTYWWHYWREESAVAVLVILEASSPRGLPGVKSEGHQSFLQSARADVEELDSSGVLAVGARLDDNGSAVLNEFPLFDAWQLGLDYGESFSIA